MAKKDLKKKIFELLEEKGKGMSIKKIAEHFKVSRTTVSKYLDILLEEGKIEIEEISHLKFWKIKNSEDIRTIFAFWTGYDAFIGAIASAYPEITDGKKLGREVAKNLGGNDFFKNLIDREGTIDLLNKYEKFKKNRNSDKQLYNTCFNELADSFWRLFNKTRLMVDNGLFEPPSIIANPPTIILRNKGQRFLDEFLKPPHQDFKFEIIAGLLEYLLLILKISIDLKYIRRPEDQIVDMIISLK
ncbi:MAG: HTH domain-containing protein [archaeon]|nr:HTH domain-containing protein [archaeon]